MGTAVLRRCVSVQRRWWVLLGLLLVPELAGARPVDAERVFTFAYIDPGTGSFLVQALAAAVAGIAVTIRMYWDKVRAFFGAAPTDAEDSEDDPLDR